MPYDPGQHHRRSIRLPGYDYSSSGAYFVTVCVQGGACLLGEIVGSEMRLNAWGRAVEQCWYAFPDHFARVRLDAFAILPNHVHGIVVIVGEAEGDACIAPTVPPDVVVTHASPTHASPRLRRASLGAIVGSFKSACSRQINELRGPARASVWQRNYWEHTIRNDASMNRIRDYIESNAARWAEDQLHPDAPPNAFNRWAQPPRHGRRMRRPWRPPRRQM